jgi:glycosyltransferase involved in cell wall biosynthesis
MNIIFYSRLYSPHIGGVEKHVAELSKLFISKGHKVTVITERFNNLLREFENINGVNVIRLNVPKIKIFGLIYLWIFQIFRLTNELKKADIIHCHDIFLWYLPFRFIFFRKPVYVTFHGYETYPIKFKLVLARKISETLSYGNICIGRFMEKWYKTKPNYISYGAVDKKFLSLKNVKNKYDAIFWGRLDKHRGILQYLELVKKLLIINPNYKWLVLGEGEYSEKLNKYATVIKSIKDPHNYISQAKIAFVSGYLSIIEGLAMKKYVIAFYDNPVKKDYLEMTPFSQYIFIVKDVNEAVNIVKKIKLNPSFYKEKINKGYRWAVNQTWNNVLKVYMDLWKY